MAERGLREEARMVWERRDSLSVTPLQAVGYKEFFPYFAGDCSWDDALEKLRLGTNRLVRSQETWFRKFPAVEAFMAPDDDGERVADRLTGIFR
jgi:tRNA dimethylallyltransferase